MVMWSEAARPAGTQRTRPAPMEIIIQPLYESFGGWLGWMLDVSPSRFLVMLVVVVAMIIIIISSPNFPVYRPCSLMIF